MRLLAIARAGLAAAAVLACVGFAAPARVDYVLAPVIVDGAQTAVAVELTFRGDADGETRLELPNEWGGQSELYRGISDLVVSGATLADGANAAERVLRHDPGARIRVRYRVSQDWEGEPAAGGGNPYRPIVQPGYFHLIGNTALIRPDLAGDTPARVRARALPRGWSFASDLEHDGLTLARVAESVSVGGDYRIVSAGDRNVRVAMRGAWSFEDAAFAREVESILAAQRDYWGDESTPYLVTVTQLAAPPGSSSLGGTNLSDAFAFFATPNAEAAVITRILAHEGLHTWVPDALGGMDEDEVAQRGHYWLSEGFTDFFTDRLLVRIGRWTPQDFAENLNGTLLAYARSPVKTAPNARIVSDFWSVSDVQRLPYQRGRLLALLWDARLRASGGGKDFDDVVFDMRARARESDAHAIALLPLAAQAQGLVLGDDLATYVEGGALVVLPEDALAPCGRIVTAEASSYDPGFDFNATSSNDWVITGVTEGGPAYAAGLRNGQSLRQASFRHGEADEERVIVVSDTPDGAPREIRYYPRGREPTSVQRLELAEALEGETLARCVAVLGG